jgi:hypothetical protein
LDDTGYAAVGYVDRLVRDYEETLGRHASDPRFDLREIGEAVMEVAASRTVGCEAPEIYRPFGTVLDQVADVGVVRKPVQHDKCGPAARKVADVQAAAITLNAVFGECGQSV